MPARADIAIVINEDAGALSIAAFAHIDPLRIGSVRELQRVYHPSIDDPVSAVARVFRTGVPELLPPAAATDLEQRVPDPTLRAALKLLGPRTTLMGPITNADGVARGVLVVAMSTSGRVVDDGDLGDIAGFAREIGRRM